MELLYATNNYGKIKDAEEVFGSNGITLISPREVKGRGAPPKVEENAGSYLGNAKLKAEAFLAWSGLPSLADDAGLEVEALPGELGVETAYYSGPEACSEGNNRKLLRRLDEVGEKERRARFVCQLVLALPGGGYLEATGEVKGRIAFEMSGGGGFGYDCVFVPDGHSLTLAELKERRTLVETHRSRALRAFFLKLGAEPGGNSA